MTDLLNVYRLDDYGYVVTQKRLDSGLGQHSAHQRVDDSSDHALGRAIVAALHDHPLTPASFDDMLADAGYLDERAFVKAARMVSVSVRTSPDDIELLLVPQDGDGYYAEDGDPRELLPPDASAIDIGAAVNRLFAISPLRVRARRMVRHSIDRFR